MGQLSAATYAVSDASGSATEAWQEALRRDDRCSPVAFLASDSLSPSDLAAACTADSDVTIIVQDPERGSGGRAAADLMAVLWQSFPAIAVFLSEHVWRAGAVVFSAEAFRRAETALSAETAISSNSDPLAEAVASIVTQGGSIRAMLMPGDSDTGLASKPPALSPHEPGRARFWLQDAIEAFDPAACLGPLRSRADAVALRAGLLLWHDFLDRSHQQSQSIEGKGVHRAGDYWHAIMHRREQDFGNAKYWFRRVGPHPVFDSLASRVMRIAKDADGPVADLANQLAPGNRWDAFAFVDLCEQDERSPEPARNLFLRRVQADEMLLLLWQTCLDARGAE
jgi:hypothetical protein